MYEPLQEEVIADDGQTQSIADQLKSAAEQAISQSDYIYDESSGLYYDQQTGYYYNPVCVFSFCYIFYVVNASCCCSNYCMY